MNVAFVDSLMRHVPQDWPYAAALTVAAIGCYVGLVFCIGKFCSMTKEPQ